ncbi:NUDIX hydrolase [Parasulfitobacter algicola]|uniref:NUDIX hydrolase n=1 Tax=Parasulfitobacter algicola TaxID=2614809 RepID=A0ABX2IPA6_9RHOB|nr:NUDIX hydrolase [Sulfitobacter algicola]NSX54722.1 NUDIX hydrolase [Sulfitobacter algicola]
MAIPFLKYTPAPINLSGAQKTDVRTQFAALCYRVVNGKTQILLITSRGTGRWILPKGWPMDGKTPAVCAGIEAFEEAGVEGKTYDSCIGVFSYIKAIPRGDNLPILAMVFPIKVKHLVNDYPEAQERRRKWFTLKKAAARIDEPELRHIILNFDPRRLKP